MTILWRHRLTLVVLCIILVLLGCEAQIPRKLPAGKLLFARGNHWAVGHLMGKKSVEEALNPNRQGGDTDSYFITAEANRDTRVAGIVRALLTQLSGLTEEQRRSKVSDFHQADDVLLLALNVRDADG